jgi:hypothetical protein
MLTPSGDVSEKVAMQKRGKVSGTEPDVNVTSDATGVVV